MADRIRILIVDDEPALLEIGKLFLEQSGEFSVDTVISAAEALDALTRKNYDAIVSDYQMPEMDGINFLKIIRTSDKIIPFIIFTGRSREEIVIEALNNGADFYLQKGGDTKSLYRELVHVIRQSVQMRRTVITLAEQEQRYHDLQNANDLIQSVAPDGHFLFVNKKWLDTLGYEEHEVPDLTVFDVIDKESLNHCMETFQRVMSGENVGIIDAVFRNRDGMKVYVEGMANCKIVDGQPQYTRGIFKDVTKRKKTEEALRESEERFRAMVEKTRDVIWEVDLDGRYTYISPQIQDILGYSPEEVMGKTCFDLMLPDEGDKIRVIFGEIAASGKPIEWLENTNLHKDGRRVILETSGEPIRAADGTISGYRGIDRDITDRKKAEKKIRNSENYLKSLLDSIPTGIIVVDAGTHTILQANPSALALFGAPSDDIVGKICHKVICPAEVGKCPVTDLGLTIDCAERALTTADGRQIPIFKTVVPSSIGGNTVLVESFIDISQRKQAETALREANRKLNMLSSITRHDINNQLLAINGFVDLLHCKIPDPSFNNYFSRITEASNQINAMIMFTKEYEKIGVHAPLWQNIQTLVNSAGNSAALGKITLKNDLPANTEVFADPLIVKVFFNLIDNALRHGGNITKIRFSCDAYKGNRIIVCEDDGEGVASEEKEKIFDRGFGKNTGFGLAISREILDITGITIKETGHPGKGARFEIAVPEGQFRSIIP